MLPGVSEFDERWLAAMVPGRVSVVMACYNVERYMAVAVDSALAQAGDIEVVLADDGSKDATRAIIADYAGRHANVIALYSPSNQGPFALRNWGMRVASGELIAFLDGDDYWSPGKLAAQRAALDARPDAELSHHYLMRVDEHGAPQRRLQLGSERYDGACFLAMLGNNGVATSATVVRRTAIARVGGFDERFRYRGDWEMWTRIAQVFPFAFVGEELGCYRVHGDNVSGKTSLIRPYAFAVLEKFANEFGLTAAEIATHVDPTRATLHKSYGLMSLVDRDLPAARRNLWAAMRRAPDRETALGLVKSVVYGLRP